MTKHCLGHVSILIFIAQILTSSICVCVCVCVCVGVLTSLSARYFLHICHDVCSFIRIHQCQKWNVLQTAASKVAAIIWIYSNVFVMHSLSPILSLIYFFSLSVKLYGIVDYIWVSWKSISIILQFNFSVYFYILFTRLTRAPCVALAIFACLCNEARTANKTRRHFEGITFQKGTATTGAGQPFWHGKICQRLEVDQMSVAIRDTFSLQDSPFSEAFSLLFK